MTTSVKMLVISAAVAASMAPLSAMMPPKALTGSQNERLAIGLDQSAAGRNAAGVGVLDDGDGGRRRVEFGDQLKGGVGVVEIVVGKLLALVLHGGGHARAPRRRDIEGGR